MKSNLLVESIALGLLGGLALFVIPAVVLSSPKPMLQPPAPAPQQPVEVRGRYALVAGPDGTMLRLDTAMGRVWRLSSMGEVQHGTEPRWKLIRTGD